MLFKYSVLTFPPPLPTILALPTSLPYFHTPCNCPCVLYNCSSKSFSLFPYNPLLSPLWSLSACSQFWCLWLYFACLFILLIRFLLKMRSYSIWPSPPGLFHLTIPETTKNLNLLKTYNQYKNMTHIICLYMP